MCQNAVHGGAKTTGAFTKFRLLMWKNSLQQWRHPLQTAAEIIVPIMFMALVITLRSQIRPSVRHLTHYPVIPAHTLSYSLNVLEGMNTSQMILAYSPQSPILEDVMQSAVINLVTQNLETIIPILNGQFPELEIPSNRDVFNETTIEDIAKIFITVQGYNSSQSLSNIYSSEDVVRKVIAAVEFNDALYGSTEIPNNIRYALRFPERPRMYSFRGEGGPSWRTYLAYPSMETVGPRFPFELEDGTDPGYINEMFIAIQHVISLELISRVSGEDLRDFHINVQKLPYPTHVDDVALTVFPQIMPLLIVMSFTYTAINIVRAITVEKELQLKETMKIMGLPTWLHWTAWFCKYFIYLLIIASLLVPLVKINWFTTEGGFSKYAVFTHTDWTVIFFFLILYLSCTIFFCFMLSGFFSKASTGALFTSVLWLLSYVPATLLSEDLQVSPVVQGFTCLSLNTAMAYGFQLIFAKELSGGMQWGEFMKPLSPDSNRLTFGLVVTMLAVDCVLYMLVALYLEQVLPGPYGAPKPWYFILQKTYWFPNNQVVSANYTNLSEGIVMEQEPRDRKIGVTMTNLTKAYGSHIAVNNLSLNIYDDQITVLLGHNGAGKSTTMSMFTGNVKVTSGSVWLAGYNVVQQPAAARAQLGFCPQHNVLFNELTVWEHLVFFARLKGLSGKSLQNDVTSLIHRLELDEKRNYQAGGLSGGQKRRLSVGIALSGSPRVVLLDEPTSGMDPASRRALWDLLQREKAGRSMILTTHFMDEADILGDRVAIMAGGRLQCVGSPYFLKRHYGVGYTLVVVKKHDFRYETCTRILKKYIPGIQINEDRGSEVTYALTNDQAYLFEAMLSDLESNEDNIQFQNYGLTATTLEDVFMSIGSDVDVDHSDPHETDFETSSTDPFRGDRTRELKGARLWAQHVWAVWQKLWLVWSRSVNLMLLQVLVPVLLVNVTLVAMHFVEPIVREVVPRALKLTEGYSETETMLTYDGTESSSSIGALGKAAYENMFNSANIETMKLTLVENQSLDNYFLQRNSIPEEMAGLRRRLLMGASFTAEGATAWFSNFAYHDVATSLAAVHAALLKAYNPIANIDVYNYPLQANYREQSSAHAEASLVIVELAYSIGISLAIVSAVFVMFYVKERVSGAKLLQKASGIQPVIMWGSAALFDLVWFLIICLTIVTSCVAFGVTGMSSFGDISLLYLAFVTYGFAMLPFHYVMSLLFGGPALGFVVMFFMNLFGVTLAVMPLMAFDEDLSSEIPGFTYIPMYGLVESIFALLERGLTEWLCQQQCQSLPVPTQQHSGFDSTYKNNFGACCGSENLEFETKDFWIGVSHMATSGVVFWALFMFIEYRVYRKIYNPTKTPPPLDYSALDSDVADERVHVARVDSTSLAEHSLIAKGLSKYYKKHLAVNQVSFTVADGEVFGLLGVNGAGKTTTFKMLMGDETISSGDAFVGGYSVKRNITKVHENIGYCPQFDAVFGELTGRETLRLFSLLRGLRGEHAEARAAMLAHALGFTKHLDKRVEQYSGGNKRKLSTAVALLGHTRLVFVDEPTTGVDPAAKRQVWRAVRGARRAGRGVVLTSHSMEECEALCSRLTIMVNGQFQCLGTPQHLKTKFSQGFVLTIKMKTDEDWTHSTPGERDIASVKEYIESNFITPKLMEEYQGLLTYYLPDRSVAWSSMFGIMERCRQRFEVEDYTISQTTLEQIFLQFTKFQKEELSRN